ncbi:triglyceride lipase triglyceride lipase [Euphorbia peplus]|nr:triglyceride lipase triglyceride lipase [Euphorbia peplus]
MASLQTNPRFYSRLGAPSRRHRNLSCLRPFPVPFYRNYNLRGSHCRGFQQFISCSSKENAAIENVYNEEESERPPFDINLAVVLAGFAFEAYTTPPAKVGRSEIDAAGCKTIYLLETFVREIYDGQLFVKLKKGLDLPAMDPWGTSDPYVVMQLDGQVVKSKTKWGKKEPTWNEEFTFNFKQPPTENLQVAAWDANLVTPHKRMGNASINLESLCDGNLYEVLVELEGMGGGGKVQLEVKYKTFDEIVEEKKWWMPPFASEFLRINGFDSAMQNIVGSEAVPARQFVEYAFGQLKSFNDAYLPKDGFLKSNDTEVVQNSNNIAVLDNPSEIENVAQVTLNENISEIPLDGTNSMEVSQSESSQTETVGLDNAYAAELEAKAGETKQSNKLFWKNFADVINQNVVQKLGLDASMELKWDSLDFLNKIGLQSQNIAEAAYIESGLATPEGPDADSDKSSAVPAISAIQPSLPDIKKATEDLLRQTDSVLGALMVLTSTVSKLNKEAQLSGKDSSESEKFLSAPDTSGLVEEKAEEMRELFSTAESAMEAWAMLAISLGHPSFIKSEFEKLCFLDNESTDTQVAIWRDSARKRLVVAFRGTEQTRWKDLLTDLRLVPAGLNPERIGGDFKEEIQVHSGFLSAYDSVRTRIISIIKQSIGYNDNGEEPPVKWRVYVTGHSLGGALATLLALELSSSQLSKCGAISVTMYNFGSPRVGNRKFAEVYNQKVKDTWRVVNHRDIIPTVPRLMGYCHVAQPVYLAAGELIDALENLELSKDGYPVDVIGESTPDVLVQEFMKGEMELIEKILQTEINIFRAIRDGTAFMQHMEDFYYVTLLENVRSSYRTASKPSNEEDGTSIG